MSFLSRAAHVALVASFFAAAGGSAAEQPSNASGSLTMNGQKTALHHAYAFHNAQDNTTRVLISDRALDAAMLAGESGGESSGDTPSLRDLTKQGKASAVELYINNKNEIETVKVFHKVFGMPTPTSGQKFWYEPYRLPGAWIGGRSRAAQPQSFFKDVWDYDVTFLAPIGQKSYEIPTAAAIAAQHKANDAREAARVLPAGGGDEGAMYLAYRHNIDTRNTKALNDQLTASMKTAIAADLHTTTPLNDSALGSWAFMQSMPVGKVDVVGGVRETDGTTLELRKTSDGRKSFGTAKLVKDHGAWKVAEENWR